MANENRINRTDSDPDRVGEVIERLERIETRIEDLQTLVDLQLEGTADIKREMAQGGES
jgi:tetrahydromethanopterin S-methyltransferase subunit G